MKTFTLDGHRNGLLDMLKIFWPFIVGIVALYAVVIGLMIHDGREAAERHQRGMEALVEMRFGEDK